MIVATQALGAWRGPKARDAAHSPTGSQADIFANRFDDLRPLGQGFPPEPGQAGALLALGDRLCLVNVSRPAAFARLYSKLPGWGSGPMDAAATQE